jgi:trk system potassium uptake protein TrkH
MRDGILLVVLTWSLLPAFAALPLIIFMPELPLADAYFEAMSGLTATGATVLSGLDDLPDSINLWRAQLHWIGGLGVIVLVAAVLPLLGVGGRQMFKAEMPTPMKDQKLTPRMAETAKGLWLVYVILTAVCILVLWALGMSFFDAVVHAFSIMGLGGFSSHDASLGYFDSLPLEIAVGHFALIAGINFATHFAVLRGRTLRVYRHDPEIRWFLGFVLISGVMLALLLWQRDVFLDFPSALRYASVQRDFHRHHPGLRHHRLRPVAVLRRPVAAVPVQFFHQRRLHRRRHQDDARGAALQAGVPGTEQADPPQRPDQPLRLGEEVVPNKIVYAVLAFLFIYVASIVSLSFVLSFTGLDVLTAFSAVVACINNTGPGLGQVGPATTYAVLTDFQTSVCTFAMLLGRLELFTLLVVLTPAFWRR